MAAHVFDGTLLSREFLRSVLKAAKFTKEAQVIQYRNGQQITLSANMSFEDAVTLHLDALKMADRNSV